MPKKDASLGRALIKAHKRKGHFVPRDGFRHTTDIEDGRDFGRLNLHSVTEQTSLDDFLDKVALAESDFTSELSNVKIVDPKLSNGVLSEEEKAQLLCVQERNKEILCIPRRPYWNLEEMMKEEIDANEREEFLKWRRKLAFLQETEDINLTPFEKNMEVWRQLWRVIERSDIIVQIVDARNPLLFRCTDLEAYVKEVSSKKVNILLLNKSDLLTEAQRKCWCDEYFDKIGMQIAFFSALEQEETSNEDVKTSTENKFTEFDSSSIRNSPQILSREELISFFKALCKDYKSAHHVPTVGLVGYPNVGKSSTLNSLLQCKKVCVSATPGKTKHFQTHLIDEDLCLCDCPGLVFPNFISTKAEMVINGILPIDQLTEWNQPITLITNMIPRRILETTYSLLIPKPGEDRDVNSKPTAEEFLNAYGYNRGFMTQRGLPDTARSARYILKDFVNGKLLNCEAPPDVSQEKYHEFPEVKPKKAVQKTGEDVESKITISAADKKFFSMTQMHTKGSVLNKGMPSDVVGKPWKKHNNRNKKEKLRRIYKAYE